MCSPASVSIMRVRPWTLTPGAARNSRRTQSESSPRASSTVSPATVTVAASASRSTSTVIGTRSGGGGSAKRKLFSGPSTVQSNRSGPAPFEASGTRTPPSRIVSIAGRVV